MLKRLKAQGITILVSTPYMDEAMLCDRIALMQNGRILAVDPPRLERLATALEDAIELFGLDQWAPGRRDRAAEPALDKAQA